MQRKGSKVAGTKKTTKKAPPTAPSPPASYKPGITPPSSALLVAVVVVVLSVLLAALWHAPLSGGPDRPWSLARNVRRDLGVPVVDGWSGTGGGSFFAAIADHRSLIRGSSADDGGATDDVIAQASGGGPVPVVLRRTALIERWPALSLWRSPEYLASRPELKEMTVDVGHSNTFLYVDKGQDMWTQGVPNMPDQNYSSVHMNATDFFRRIHGAPDGKYYYHYGRVRGSLAADVSPSDPLWRTRDDAAHFGLFLWLSGADVRPAIHFDSDHNFFVHLNGSKKFVLFPPWQWENLYLYPRIHPSWHKSQLSFDAVPLETYPNAPRAHAYEVLLEPGDVLHVPPYWFHHVESTTPSVSLASWSEFSAHQPMHELFTVHYETLTWRHYRGKDQIIAVKLYIEMLAKRVLGSRAQQFIETVLSSRWSEPMQRLVRESATIRCDARWEATCDRDMLEGLRDDVDITMDCFERLVEPSLKDSRYARAIADILLADWIELSASEVVGAANTFLFLRDCIYFPA